ncbi:MAG: hypothetical protein IIA61_13615 [Candidatus Marinimicrobia bacterium]|nr:hypothetical protein [Candidatus Neomarinimicrobiota bacterium]
MLSNVGKDPADKETTYFFGDGHYWIYDYPWLAPNIIRIQVDKEGIADPLQVTIASERQVRFEFERYPFRNGN